ncbi:hypothetical protein ACROYT_G000327 [Oculina patagonica]
MGPGTKLAKRLKRGDPGINRLDKIAKQHDIDYSHAKNLRDKWKADEKMIKAINKLPGSKTMTERIVKRIMQAKKNWNSLEKDGIVFYKQVNKEEKARYIRQGNFSLDDIGSIFEKGFPEKNMFSVTKGIAGRSLIIKAKEPNLKAFGLNGSLIKFFNLPGIENYASIEKEYFETIETMSSANVLPSAPAYGDREETQLYPSLPTNAENFRLTEISKIEKEISAEAEHYRLVLKKYKKVRKVIHYSVVCLGAVTAALSSGAVATSLTGVGIVIGVPVAAVAGISGAASTGLSVINKKLERKVNKHSRILALAVAKHDSINSSVSQALNDNLVSDKEFQLITREMQKYRQLKDTLRSNFAKKQTNSLQPDIGKIREEIKREERKRLEKKLLESATDISK